MKVISYYQSSVIKLLSILLSYHLHSITLINILQNTLNTFWYIELKIIDKDFVTGIDMYKYLKNIYKKEYNMLNSLYYIDIRCIILSYLFFNNLYMSALLLHNMSLIKLKHCN